MWPALLGFMGSTRARRRGTTGTTGTRLDIISSTQIAVFVINSLYFYINTDVHDFGYALQIIL